MLTRTSERNQAIDAFRGLSIVAMVFFTLTLKLSSDLPELLRHNVKGSLHLGDFVLPMFLFASGMSIAYFMRNREGVGNKDLAVDVAKRFSLLAMVGLALSPISTRGTFEMDEVMLSALLFPICVILSKLNWVVSMSVMAFITLLYLAVMNPAWSGIELASAFEGHYLGGYAAAPFYLPLMLAGLIIGRSFITDKKNSYQEVQVMILLVTALFLLSLMFVPIDKLAVSPSFMMLSILFCCLVLYVVSKIMPHIGGLGELRYLGHKPLRYWILMYIFFIAPIILIANTTGTGNQLDLPWGMALLLSVCAALVLWMISQAIDIVDNRLKKSRQK